LPGIDGDIVTVQALVERVVHRMDRNRQPTADCCEVEILCFRELRDVLAEIAEQCTQSGVLWRRRFLRISLLIRRDVRRRHRLLRAH
jgi:hypothetical protein